MTAPVAGPTGRRYAAKTPGQRRQERRARILASGLQLFGSRGHRATTIEALCTAAKVSTRNFYEEFSSREAVVIALHDDVNARALQAVTAALDGTDLADVAGRARAATAAYFGVMTSDRHWARIALVESVGIGDEAEAHRREAIDSFVALMEAEANRLAREGLVERRDYHLTAVGLAGALNALVNTWTANTDWSATVPRIAEEASRLIVRALTSS